MLVGATAFSTADFGEGTGPIFIDELHCSGMESDLLDCPSFQPVGLHHCDHTMDAGVKCIGRRPVTFNILHSK